MWFSDVCDTFLQLCSLALTDVLQFCLILSFSDVCDTFLQLYSLALTDVLQFCLILWPGGKDQKVAVLFHVSRTEEHFQCLLVPHTLVVLLTTLTALNLQTCALYCDVNPHLQGISVLLLTSVLSRWQQFCHGDSISVSAVLSRWHHFCISSSVMVTPFLYQQFCHGDTISVSAVLSRWQHFCISSSVTVTAFLYQQFCHGDTISVSAVLSWWHHFCISSSVTVTPFLYQLFTESSLDVLKPCLQPNRSAPAQSNISIPKIHHLCIGDTLFVFTLFWTHQKRLFFFLMFVMWGI
jgi:hypothetical protein